MRIVMVACSEDITWSTELSERLGARLGATVSLHPPTSTNGSTWPAEVVGRLDEADLVVSLLSPELITTPWLHEAHAWASGRGVRTARIVVRPVDLVTAPHDIVFAPAPTGAVATQPDPRAALLAAERFVCLRALGATRFGAGAQLIAAGDVSIASEDPDEAEACYDSAVAVGRIDEDHPTVGHGHLRLAFVRSARGAPEDAEEHLRQAFTSFQAMHDAAGAGQALVALANLPQYRARPVSSRRLLQSARRFYDTAGDLAGLAAIERQLGTLAREADDHDTADAHFQIAVDLAFEAKLPGHALQTCLTAAAQELEATFFDRCAAWLDEARRLATELGDVEALAACDRIAADLPTRVG